MSLQDPISDMLTQIRNGQMANKEQVMFPHSKAKVAILDVLEEEGYILGFKEIQEDNINISNTDLYLKINSALLPRLYAALDVRTENGTELNMADLSFKNLEKIFSEYFSYRNGTWHSLRGKTQLKKAS